jgi:hypothetical protein
MVHINADFVAAAAAALNFTQVALTPPLNWIAGDYLFPSQIIAGYNADVAEYTAEEWSAHMLDACKNFRACTSFDGFQGNYAQFNSFLPPFIRTDGQFSNKQWQYGRKILVRLRLSRWFYE